ncbi:electron transfer flavoprotein subunit alpha/FixB family protein [Paraburkholderia sp. UCT2]|uniref:electron transfer flavoprotein subunit alpha/FixB family protein n=1 Tax=Paraburkholderia sp. UCT2 TaxID=2615208 RepID=UPI0016553C8C|nr:electron transfer flavoprotein subunit alpha/FixB family protein [Paraburkholderia sp. UCT2]MBC8727755.1 electron transfer flavoprotein subunit alpha/FixB family protein [Paraburkholderia sp. UCT2]
MTTLVIAEHDNERIKTSTLHTVTAGRQLSDRVHVLIAGQTAQPAAQAASQIEGIDKVILVDAPWLADGIAENIAAQILNLSIGYTHLLFPATAFGKNVAPRVAAKLDASQVSDVIAIHSPDTFDRPIYAGNAIATVQSNDTIKVATIRTTAFEPAPFSGGTAAIETREPVAENGRARFIRREVATSERPDLTSARVVVSGGRGLGSAENFSLLDPVAQKLGAAVGASRAAVDSGFAPNDWQVGQTGKIVAPQLYIAVGISGAIQHLAGMKDSKIIVAINKDADAPIFSVADYGLVGDLFEVLPELAKQL